MLTKVLETPIIESSENPPSSESKIANPTIDKATFTLGSKPEKEPMFGSEKLPSSESEVAPIGEMSGALKFESEHTPDPEGKEGSESMGSVLEGTEEKKTDDPQMEEDLSILKGTQEVNPNVIVEKMDAEKEAT